MQYSAFVYHPYPFSSAARTQPPNTTVQHLTVPKLSFCAGLLQHTGNSLSRSNSDKQHIGPPINIFARGTQLLITQNLYANCISHSNNCLATLPDFFIHSSNKQCRVLTHPGGWTANLRRAIFGQQAGSPCHQSQMPTVPFFLPQNSQVLALALL